MPSTGVAAGATEWVVPTLMQCRVPRLPETVHGFTGLKDRRYLPSRLWGRLVLNACELK